MFFNVKQVSAAQVKALTTASERAHGTVYREPVQTSWKPYRSYSRKPRSEHDATRKKVLSEYKIYIYICIL